MYKGFELDANVSKSDDFTQKSKDASFRQMDRSCGGPDYMHPLGPTGSGGARQPPCHHPLDLLNGPQAVSLGHSSAPSM